MSAEDDDDDLYARTILYYPYTIAPPNTHKDCGQTKFRTFIRT